MSSELGRITKMYSAGCDVAGRTIGFPITEKMTVKDLRVSVAQSAGIIPKDSQPTEAMRGILENGIVILKIQRRRNNEEMQSEDSVDFSTMDELNRIMVLFKKDVFLPGSSGRLLYGKELQILNGWSERFLAQQASTGATY